MAHEHPTIDFTIEKPGEGIRLLVEAKNLPAPSPDWAAQFLRNLFEHVTIPPSEYFLLALQNRLYLWKRPGPEVANPDYESDTRTALAPYVVGLRYPLEKLSQSSFELLVQAWLNDLVAGTLPQSSNRQWLEDSGLAESVRDGAIRFGVAA